MADNGLTALAAAIEKSNADLVRALPGITQAGAAVVLTEVAARAPRDTGRLAASIDELQQSSRTYASKTVQVDDSAKTGIEHYAIFLEYGTSKMAARPFFRPGVEAVRGKVGALMVSQILNVITHDS